MCKVESQVSLRSAGLRPESSEMTDFIQKLPLEALFQNSTTKKYRYCFRCSSKVQTVKHLPAMLETQVQSLGQDDLLEKEMATHSSILTWKIPWTGEPGRLQPIGSQSIEHDSATSFSFFPFPKIMVQFLCASVSTRVSASTTSR